MTLDQPRRHETPAGIDGLAVAGDAGPDGGDASIRDRDVDACARRIATRQPRIPHGEIESHVLVLPYSVAAASLTCFTVSALCTHHSAFIATLLPANPGLLDHPGPHFMLGADVGRKCLR